jgi:hypothetical protein
MGSEIKGGHLTAGVRVRREPGMSSDAADNHI